MKTAHRQTQLISASAIGIAMFCLFNATSALAQNGPPPQPDMELTSAMRDETINTLIHEVSLRYVFPEVAKKIEVNLRQQLKRGDFNTITSANKLAQTLSEKLYETSQDKHMGVRYSARPLPATVNGAAPSEQQKTGELAEMKARNFGIERVERRPGNIGYLDLRGFAPAKGSGDAIGAAMRLLNNTDAMIIDLRKNGGGEPSGVAQLVSYFFEDRTHVNNHYDRSSDSTEQYWTSDALIGPRYSPNKDLYILTSKRTFSAAEEFSYDLKQLKRATLVGETTGGGAHPGDVYRLHTHFQMFIPTGRTIHPISKSDWDKVGLTPDVATAQESALAVAESAILKKFLGAAKDPHQQRELQRRLDELAQGLTAPTVAR